MDTKKMIEKNMPPNTWEQLPDETDLAYSRFVVYLKLGPERSLEKVRRKIGKSTGYTRQLEKWSVFHNWVLRVGDYDQYLTQKALEGREKIARKGQAILLSGVEEAAQTVLAIMRTDRQRLAEGEVSQTSHQLKAALEVLNRAGVTAPEPGTGQKSKADVITNYYNQIYNDLRENSKPEHLTP